MASGHFIYLKLLKFGSGCLDDIYFEGFSKLVKYVYRAYGHGLSLVYNVNIVLMSINICLNWHKQDVVIEDVTYVFTYIITYATLFFIKTPVIDKLQETIEDKVRDAETSASDQVKKIFVKYSKLNIQLTIGIMTIVSFYCGYLTWYNINRPGDQKQFIVPEWFPVDENKYYWQLICLQLCQLSGTMFLSGYTKFTVIYFINYELSELESLQLLIIEGDEFARKRSCNEEFAKHLKKIVKKHYELIEFNNELTEASDGFILLDYMGQAIALGSLLIRVTIGFEKDTLVDKIMAFYYYFIVVSVTFVTYSLADKIKEMSENISNILYEKVYWYDMNGRNKKMLLIIMSRAQKPLTLSVGPFFDMTLAAFVSIMKSSYSYVTFYKTMYETKLNK